MIEDVLVENTDGTFEPTVLGVALAQRSGPLRVRSDLYYEAARGLLHALSTGGTAFDTIYGQRFFAYLDENPVAQAELEASMAGRAVTEARDIVAAYDFGHYRTIVDVGGGRGVLLAAILEAVPAARVMLLDRPSAVEQARAHLTDVGLIDRVELVAGDFFHSVPTGGDVYLLARILHDWDDADALRILGRCRAAMTPRSGLLVVDALLPERADPLAFGAIRMDLNMLVLFGSAERTGIELTGLIDAAGFTVRRIIPTNSPEGIAIIEATPR